MSATVQFFGDRTWLPSDIDEAIGEDDDWSRYEIVDGVLIVSPHAEYLHQRVGFRLAMTLQSVVPAQFEAIGSIGIDLGRSYRVTDATVLRARTSPYVGLMRPADVMVAIEIESPSSITTDRVTKPAQYAAVGIPHYWRVELDPLRLNVHRLVGGVYELIGAWGADETATIAEPFDVTIDLAALL